MGSVLSWNNLLTVVVATVLAFATGYTLTIFPLLQTGLDLKKALGIALVSDSLSIAVMEVADNTTELLIPGALNAPLLSGLFWGSLAASLLLAFLAAYPVNSYLIARDKGHAHHH